LTYLLRAVEPLSHAKVIELTKSGNTLYAKKDLRAWAGSLEGWWAIPNFRWPAFLKNTFSGTGLGLPAPLGGLMFSSDGTVLYVVGASETTVSALYAVSVTRIQAKLLRAIQEGEVQRLGGTQVRVVDVLIGGVSGMPVRRRPAACRTAC